MQIFIIDGFVNNHELLGNSTPAMKMIPSPFEKGVRGGFLSGPSAKRSFGPPGPLFQRGEFIFKVKIK
jgi:hypothetical protein